MELTDAGAERRPEVDVVLVDDHPLFSRGLALLLPGVSEGRVRVVATTDDASAAAAMVRRHHADVAVVDLHMPPPGGTRAIAAIRRADPTVRVVALSGQAEEDAVLEALRAGAAGFLPKTADPEALVRPLLAAMALVPPGGGMCRSTIATSAWCRRTSAAAADASSVVPTTRTGPR